MIKSKVQNDVGHENNGNIKFSFLLKVQGSPFITLCLGSIELNRVISEPCYKGIIL